MYYTLQCTVQLAYRNIPLITAVEADDVDASSIKHLRGVTVCRQNETKRINATPSACSLATRRESRTV